MSQISDSVISLIASAVFLPPGAFMVTKPRRAATLNDTTGPSWVRNYNRSPGEVTTPLKAGLIGGLLLAIGMTLLVVAILGRSDTVNLTS